MSVKVQNCIELLEISSLLFRRHMYKLHLPLWGRIAKAYPTQSSDHSGKIRAIQRGAKVQDYRRISPSFQRVRLGLFKTVKK